jgi:hypothetical protein
VIDELRVPRNRETYPNEFVEAYEKTFTKIGRAIRQPIKYAGPGQWTVFPRPAKLKELENVVVIPGTTDNDYCLVVTAELWQAFRRLSLWIEALCIHEWCLFSEGIEQPDGTSVDRGIVYVLLTTRPDNRRPLTWERNHIDLLLMEGYEFTCPWTEKRIYSASPYDLDHLVPISVYPINELWNLVPADPYFNSHTKRDRLPSEAKLTQAKPYLADAYATYTASDALHQALSEDVAVRFTTVSDIDFPVAVAHAVVDFIASVTDARNLAQF